MAAEEDIKPNRTPIERVEVALGTVSLASPEEDIDSADYDVPSIPKGILSADDLNQWAKEHNFGNGKRGTYHNETSYLYLKWCNEVDREEDVEPALAVARELTTKGVLHPATQWGVYKKPGDNGGFQLFPVSPKLKAFSLSDAVYEDKHADRLHRPITDPESVLQEWVRRIDPDYSGEQEEGPYGSMKVKSDEPLASLLNTFEASHAENWGWDTDGAMYPVDVEVVNIASNINVVRQWYANRPPTDNSTQHSE